MQDYKTKYHTQLRTDTNTIQDEREEWEVLLGRPRPHPPRGRASGPPAGQPGLERPHLNGSFFWGSAK